MPQPTDTEIVDWLEKHYDDVVRSHSSSSACWWAYWPMNRKGERAPVPESNHLTLRCAVWTGMQAQAAKE